MARSQDEKGADKAVAIRRAQQKDRGRINQEIAQSQKSIATLNEERAPIAAEVRKVEAEVGPIKYIAAFIYGDNPDANVLERAVTWVIILIVIVFDPLAVVMLLAAQMTFAWIREERELESRPKYEQDNVSLSQDQIDQLKEIAPAPEETVKETIDPIQCYKCGTALVNAAGIGPFCPNRTCGVADSTSGNTVTFATDIGNDPIPPGWMFSTEKKLSSEPLTEVELAAMDDTLSSNATDTERPGDYITPLEQTKIPEAAPARGRGIMHSHLSAEADNLLKDLGTASNAGFGNNYPADPEKGDVYLRTDYLPNRLFKFNGQKWMQVDKDQTYAYEDEYIKYLIDQIDSGKYDPDLLTDLEREQIQLYLSKHAQ
jgi:hypothetical protein